MSRKLAGKLCAELPNLNVAYLDIIRISGLFRQVFFSKRGLMETVTCAICIKFVTLCAADWLFLFGICILMQNFWLYLASYQLYTPYNA